jgi:hypothetical protein
MVKGQRKKAKGRKRQQEKKKNKEQKVVKICEIRKGQLS